MNLSILTTAAARVHHALPDSHPRLALIMGSGWQDVAAGFQIHATLDYGEIPELGTPQVGGHAGQLAWATYTGIELLVFIGRRHWYEGIGLGPIAFPIVLAKMMGAQGLVLTNSAGGIRPGVKPGTVMVIDDHINLMGFNPLIGPSNPFWGPRFPDMSRVYDMAYRSSFDAAAERAGTAVTHGVYVAVSGPSYETPAEIDAFRRLGADAVGMSTVPEAILAHAAGLRVAGLSCITNAAAGATHTLAHEDVLAGAQAAMPKLTRLLQEFIHNEAHTP